MIDSTAYCWGNFAGPLIVKESEAPNYPTATIGLLVGYAIKFVCHLVLLGKLYASFVQFLALRNISGYLFYMNKYRDRTYGVADKESSNEAGMQDKTEFQNKDFRYVL
jgi:hypothetical protein